MLTRIEVKGFKTLADVAVDLGAVNVFIGANGSGKSNLLEAVGVLGAIVSGTPESESFRYRGVRHGVPSSYVSSLHAERSHGVSIAALDELVAYSVALQPDTDNPYKWLITHESITIAGKLALDRSNGKFSVSQGNDKPPLLTGMKDDSKSITPYVFFRFATPADQDQIFDENSQRDRSLKFFETISKYAIYSPSTPHLRGLIDDIEREPIGLGGSGLGRAIDEMLASKSTMFGSYEVDEIFDLIDWADDLSAGLSEQENGLVQSHKVRIGDRFMTGSHKSVSATEASEGALYVLFLLALTGHPLTPRMFAVDNFDQALHPRLACALTKMICDQFIKDSNRQMLATTHNPLVLNGLNLLDDRIRLFAVERDSTGATQINRITVTEELMSQADAGMSLSQLWVTGRLGGIPKYL